MKQRNGYRMAAPIAALLLCGSIAACNGSGTGETTSSGTGGNGGEAGAGGSGGSGGGTGGNGGGAMAAPACSPEQAPVALASWPWFGFEQALDPNVDLAAGATAVVNAVELGGLRVTFDAGGVPVRLAWVGPDLNEIFATGDMVTVTTDPGVLAYRVAGTKGQAVVLRYANATVLSQLPAIPGGGPNLSITEECVHEVMKTCPLPERRMLYTLAASIGSDSVMIPSGKTGQVGAWKIGHVKSMNTDFFVGMECTADKFFEGTVHAIEVKP